MSAAERNMLARWLPAVAVFGVVLGASLALVSAAGTDIPFHDQWDVEGRWMYPKHVDGSLDFGELARAHNEHRILWTNLLNLALFSANGHWDPLVQLSAGSLLRALVAAGLAWHIGRGQSAVAQAGMAVGVTLAFLPLAAWHNALWGFQTQVLFAVGWSLAALALLNGSKRSAATTAAGLLTGIAALLAMGPAALMPVALLGMVVLRFLRSRELRARDWGPALALLVAALALRVHVAGHENLGAASGVEFLRAFGRALAWPHTAQPLAAVVMNLPLAGMISVQLLRRREAQPGEDFVIAFGLWAVGIAAAAAWIRGGGPEWEEGVPSRYGDFLVLLPVANAWCVFHLLRQASLRWQSAARWLVPAWCVFVMIGWAGLSAEMMRRIILPRAKDREAPVRLAVAFQRSGDASVFTGQPRLLVPHPNPSSIRAVLDDPRMQGRLPPSLQPQQALGPLSRAVRVLLQHQ